MKKIKKMASVGAAGKLALQIGSASAAGLGKVGTDPGTVLQISLDQVGYPLEILTPPISTTDLNLNSTTGGKTSNGSLYSNDVATALSAGKKPRIDFIISNIYNSNNPVIVYLAYSTKLGNPSQWLDLKLNLSLDRATIHVISASRLEPVSSFAQFNVGTSTPLGKLDSKGNSVVIPVDLSDLTNAEFSQNDIYFQAVAVPLINNEPNFAQAVVSDLDYYVISTKTQSAPNNGSKVSQVTASKQSSTPASNSGGKASSSSGGKTSTSGTSGSSGGKTSSSSSNSGGKK